MLSTLDVLTGSGLSRATLNNYINLGLIPRPIVKPPEAGMETRARQIGFFPEDILIRLERIRELKASGFSMSDIPHQLTQEGFEMQMQTVQQVENQKVSEADESPMPSDSHKSPSLRLTVDRIPFPAYMVNYNFEITWYNEEARTDLLGGFERLPSDIRDRNALSYLMKGKYALAGDLREELMRMYLTLCKDRLSKDELKDALQHGILSEESSLAELRPSGTVLQLPLTLRSEQGDLVHYKVLASYYREGILLVYVPGQNENDSLLGLLERRDDVIRNLLKKRLPVLTDVAVLVADLQNSVRICTELPPEEYFELINQIWATMEPIFRKYYGTHGKHVGDGMVYYFFPQPDCHYILNALTCAQEMNAAMRKISKEWQLRKNWLNELYLNTGLNEGQEWMGVFHIETKVEFTVLGDTINHAARLSDFARGGAIWATKGLLGKLPSEERQRIRYGIRRKDGDGREVIVQSSYSRVTELVDMSLPRNEKLGDIAALPVTEIFGVDAATE